MPLVFVNYTINLAKRYFLFVFVKRKISFKNLRLYISELHSGIGFITVRRPPRGRLTRAQASFGRKKKVLRWLAEPLKAGCSANGGDLSGERQGTSAAGADETRHLKTFFFLPPCSLGLQACFSRCLRFEKYTKCCFQKKFTGALFLIKYRFPMTKERLKRKLKLISMCVEEV